MVNYEKLKNAIDTSLTNDAIRVRQQYLWIYAILGVIALLMSFVNFFTAQLQLLHCTIIFSALCFSDILIAKIGKHGLRISAIVFLLEITSLFIFFIITGVPEGFSPFWICMVPAFSMLMFGKKEGTVLSAGMFAVLIFFYYIPIGQNLLRYDYTDSFMLRFPLIYVAFFAVSYFLETVRVLIYRKMRQAEKQYEYLYSHDSLTGLYNRYGYDSYVDKLFSQKQGTEIVMMIIDIDHFKQINDKYGHLNGDVALKLFSHFLSDMCKNRAEVCRWGGEEFAVIYSGNPKNTDCEAFAQELLIGIRNKNFTLNNATVNITVSIGVANTILSSESSAESLAAKADACLFKAKNNGRDTVVTDTIGYNRSPVTEYNEKPVKKSDLFAGKV